MTDQHFRRVARTLAACVLRSAATGKTPLLALIPLAILTLTACYSDGARLIGKGSQTGFGMHLSTKLSAVKSAARRVPGVIPQPVATSAHNEPTYSIQVQRGSVQDLLHNLARDAKLNLDIHPQVEGMVSINAVKQTLPKILERITRQVDMRYEVLDDTLSVVPDTPFLRHYQVNYVNLSRQMESFTAVNSLIGQSGALPLAAGVSDPRSGVRIANKMSNDFWSKLENNIKDLLRETDKIFPQGSSETLLDLAASSTNKRNTPIRNKSRLRQVHPKAKRAINALTEAENDGHEKARLSLRQATFREAASVIIHPESGVVSVRATARQHARVSKFIERVQRSAQRQVMIEATIIEVELSDSYQQGIEWSRMRSDGSGFSIRPAALGASVVGSVQPFILSLARRSDPLNISAILNLLHSYGEAKVISSPRLSVLNNQTALLKVVENFVYFNVKSDTVSTANSGNVVTVSTSPQSVSIGLVMAVTPQVSESKQIILNVRPSISSIAALREDPNPVIPAGVKNYVPQVRTREIESVMRLESGEIAVLGGLMEDSFSNKTGEVPILGKIPLLGEIFTGRANSGKKSELVIFLRPLLIDNPSLHADFADLRTKTSAMPFRQK